MNTVQLIPPPDTPHVENHPHPPKSLKTPVKQVENTILKQLGVLNDLGIQTKRNEERNSEIFQSSFSALKKPLQTKTPEIKHPLERLWNTVCSVFQRVVTTIFDPETYKIHNLTNWLLTSKKAQEEHKLTQVLTSLKHQHQISPKLQQEIEQQFAADKTADLHKVVLGVIGQLKYEEPIYSELVDLLKNNQIYSVFRYINDEQLLSKCKNSSKWNAVISPKERALLTPAEVTLEDSFENDRLHTLLESISCRLTVKQAIDKQIDNPAYADIRSELIPIQKRINRALIQNDENVFAESYFDLLAELTQQHPKQGIETRYLNDIAAFLKTTPPTPALFQKLSLQFAQEAFFDAWIQRAEKLQHKFAQIKEIKEEEVEDLSKLTSQLYQHYGKLLETDETSHISETKYAAQYGSIVAGWRKINTLFHKLTITPKNQHAHTVCSCHYAHPITAKDDLQWKGLPSRVDGLKSVCEVPQFYQEKEEKTVLFLYAPYGGGHRSAADAVMGYTQVAANEYNYHVRSINASMDVLLKTDLLHNTLGKVFEWVNMPWFYNYLQRMDMTTVLAYLMELTGSGTNASAPTVEERAKTKDLFRQAILKEKPDLLVMTYAIDAASIAEVAEELGIPLLQVACDFDACGWKQEVKHPAFKMALPVEDSQIINSTGKFIRKDQLTYPGPCVRLPFEAPVDIALLRKERGIAPEEKVVLFSSGGTGVPTNLPSVLATEWNDTTTPIRMIVVTGDNQAYADDLENNVRPIVDASPNIKLDIRPKVDAKEMAELMHVADTIVGKPGGLTAHEAFKTGTPFLGDQLKHRFDWELFNNEFLISLKQGDKLEKQDDFIPALKRLFQHKKSINTARSSEAYATLMAELIHEAEESELLRTNRKNWDINQPIEV